MRADTGSAIAIRVSEKAVISEHIMDIPVTFYDKYGSEGLWPTLEG